MTRDEAVREVARMFEEDGMFLTGDWARTPQPIRAQIATALRSVPQPGTIGTIEQAERITAAARAWKAAYARTVELPGGPEWGEAKDDTAKAFRALWDAIDGRMFPTGGTPIEQAARAFVEADQNADLFDLHSEDPASVAEWNRLLDVRRDRLMELWDAVLRPERGDATDAE